MTTERRIFDADDLRRALIRMAHEIVESHGGTDDLVLIGLRTRGFPLAERLAALIEEHEHATVPVGSGASAIIGRGMSRSALIAQLRQSRDAPPRREPRSRVDRTAVSRETRPRPS